MSEHGNYEVELRLGIAAAAPLRRTFPFGQWAEIGFWLDELGAGAEDELVIRFHPLASPRLSLAARERSLDQVASELRRIDTRVQLPTTSEED